MPIFRRTFAAAVATAGLLVSTAATAANPAAKLSVAPAARASLPAGKSKAFAEGSTATIISVGILVVFAGVVLATTGGDDNGGGSPSSP